MNNQNKKNSELDIINSFAKIYRRNPLQLNGIHESDCELIKIDENKILALSVDTMEEEIQLGFYSTLESIGYSAVMTSLSDLAAVGARPIGILCSLTFDSEFKDEDKRQQIARGIEKACVQSNVNVLGGDTNWSDRLAISITVIGIIEGKLPLMRTNIKAGDILYSTGLMGSGSLRAMMALNKDSRCSQIPLPVARLKEGMFISQFASACIDSSDGFVYSLDQLMNLNSVGFNIDRKIFEDDTLKIIEESNIPKLAFLSSGVGEYELIFSIPPNKLEAFEAESKKSGYCFYKIGAATVGNKLIFNDIEIERKKLLGFDIKNIQNQEFQAFIELCSSYKL